jgi:anaerobic C4-dicarboxylate transporter
VPQYRPNEAMLAAGLGVTVLGMVGGQHRAAGLSPRSALKSGRFLLSLFVLGVLPLALLGLAVYLLIAGTDTERLSTQWVIWMIMLISAILRRRDGALFLVWTAASLVLLTTSQLASIYAQHRGRATTHAVTLINHGLLVAAVVCIGVATVIGARSCILWWRRRRLAQP